MSTLANALIVEAPADTPNIVAENISIELNRFSFKVNQWKPSPIKARHTSIPEIIPNVFLEEYLLSFLSSVNISLMNLILIYVCYKYMIFCHPSHPEHSAILDPKSPLITLSVLR